MVDYSKWKDIEVSDDEDDTHPNIDTQSLFRWRHESRIQRMTEMEMEKEDITKVKQELSERKKQLELKKKADAEDSEVRKLEKEFNADARKLAERENVFAKKEKLSPWNVDTISQQGFSKTVINNRPPISADKELTEEEKAKRLQKFTKDNESLLKQFGMLRKYEDSKRFLLEHTQLVSEDTANYLVIWCITLELEKKFDLMNHVSHQCIAIQFLLELAKQLDRDPRTCVGSFFTKIAQGDQTEYQGAFNTELELFRERVRRRAEEKIKEALKEAEDEEAEERKQRLGPGGLDPVEVFESLPEILQKCFEARDIPMLQKALTDMPELEARQHLKRCIDSGLWCPSKDDENADNEKSKPDATTKTSDEVVPE